jgi:hypothetical protein
MKKILMTIGIDLLLVEGNTIQNARVQWMRRLNGRKYSSLPPAGCARSSWLKPKTDGGLPVAHGEGGPEGSRPGVKSCFLIIPKYQD